LADTIGADGALLLHAIYSPEAPAYLRTLAAIDILRQVWVQNYLIDGEGRRRWRDNQNIPPAARFVSSPYDVEAHYACKHNTQWVGYKVHLTETCDDETPPLIVDVLTTTAPVDDSKATAPIHTALETKGLLPACHIVDTGYVDAELLAVSRRDYDIDLCGPARGSVRWQAHTEGAFDISHFTIDWEQQKVTCPMGHTSLSWTPALDNRDNDVIKIKFARGDCRDCAARSKCTRTARRNLTLRPREQHEALMASRARQSTPEFKAAQARRSGIEGTLSYGIRTCRMRRARYVGLAKTHLQQCASAAVMNLARVARWLAGEPRAQTRQTPFQKLRQAAA
jgi:transposase